MSKLAVLSVVDPQPFAWPEITLENVPAHLDFSPVIRTEKAARMSTALKMMTAQQTNFVTGCLTPA